MGKLVLAWAGLLLLAVINGAARDFLYLDIFGLQRAHQISTITLLLIMTIYCYFVFYYRRLNSMSEAVKAGLLWVALTLAFEFLFGHYVGGHSWEKLLSQYNLPAGNLWVLIVIWTGVLPVFYYKFFQKQK